MSKYEEFISTVEQAEKLLADRNYSYFLVVTDDIEDKLNTAVGMTKNKQNIEKTAITLARAMSESPIVGASFLKLFESTFFFLPQMVEKYSQLSKEDFLNSMEACYELFSDEERDNMNMGEGTNLTL